MSLRDICAVLVDDRSDRGASAILVAVALLVILGFAAVAIDSGIVFDDRREQQAAADTGALAAVQFARTTLNSGYCTANTATDEEFAVCRGAEEAIDLVDANLPGRYVFDAADPAAEWNACVDTARPARFTRLSPQTPCISFTHNLQEARVVLPGEDVETPLGRTIGVSSKRVSAHAHALLEADQSADILPFAVGPTGAGQSQSCLFAQATAQLDILPCEASDSGNFGKLDISLYGNTKLGTIQNCGNSDPQGKMAVNIAVGADHNFELASASTGTVNDIANCPIIPNPVDELLVQTGNAAQGISNGLFYGIATPALEGRIMCKDGDSGELEGKDSGGECESVWNQFPEQLDDNPLWDYVDGSNDLNGGACDPSGLVDRATMQTCLVAYAGLSNPDPLFLDSLRSAPRFAAVPVLDSDPSGGSGWYDIIDFKPVYLETVYMKCNANTCDVVHSPGEGNPTPPGCPSPLTPATSHCGAPGNGNADAIEALTSFMLTKDMLPDSIAENFPGTEGTIVFNLSE